MHLILSLFIIALGLTYLCRARVLLLIGRLFSEPGPIRKLPSGVTVTRDIRFKKTEHGNLYLDIYRPSVAKRNKLPVVIWIFGGGWMMGNKNQIRFMKGHHLALHGYAVVSISYRLSHQSCFPAQIEDVKSAIRWVRRHADEYGFEPGSIGLWGGSAGGHLSALAATSGDDPSLESPDEAADSSGVTCRVQAAVDFFGPTDMLQVEQYVKAPSTHFVYKLFGGPLEANRRLVGAANPMAYIGEGTPPMLIVHGKGDSVVPYQQSVALHEKLKLFGNCSELCLFEKAGHGIGREFRSDALFDRVRGFFDTHLKATTGEIRTE